MFVGLLTSVVLDTAALKNQRITELRFGHVQFAPMRKACLQVDVDEY
jgi:hypothetical protein